MSQAYTLGEVLAGLDTASRGVRFLQGRARETWVSYADLLARARGLLAVLQQHGLKPGDPLLLFLRNNMAFVDAFWACQLGGLVPVPLSAGMHSEYLHKLETVARKFDAPFLFTQRDLWQRIHARGAGHVFGARVCLLETIARFEGEPVLHRARPEDAALIQFSSGSTSEPKGVVLSHANLIANIRAISAAAAIEPGDVTLSWMPLSHDMGLIGFHLVPLYNALGQVLMDTESFLRRPLRWLQAAAECRASLLCSPNFGYQHYLKAAAQPASDLDLSQVRLIFNGAEPVSAAVCREFAERLAPAGLDAQAFYPVYGMAEASLAVTFPAPRSGVQSITVAADRLSVGDTVSAGAGQRRILELVCLGKPVAGCEVRVCDAAGAVLPPRSVGHIQIRGENVTRGYYRCPECDRALNAAGWLDSGDLGFLTGDGLYLTGRAKDILFVNGQNWYPQDIEQLLQHAAQLETGKVAVAAARNAANSADLVLVFVQHRRGVDGFAEIAQRVQRALSAHAGLHADAVLPVPSLPRTTSGKLQRYRLAQAFERGGYDTLMASLQALVAQPGSAAAAKPIELQLQTICQQVFAGRTLAPDQNLFELGADSLMLVKIHEQIEARFPAKVDITDLFEYPTIAALAAYLERLCQDGR
jgi:acyl-CoA synthetase (AMP-forming)/AMP-acid ligase II/acyl carrier protein